MMFKLMRLKYIKIRGQTCHSPGLRDLKLKMKILISGLEGYLRNTDRFGCRRWLGQTHENVYSGSSGCYFNKGTVIDTTCYNH